MQVKQINSSQTKKTLILSTLSAIICGLIQSEWIFWIPGIIFGILFSIVNFRRKFQMGLYAALSCVIYIAAVRIFFLASGNDLDHYLIGGLLAGAFGALALAVVTKLTNKTSLTLLNELLSTIIGGITGIAFVQLFIYAIGEPLSSNNNLSWVLLPVAFAIWQVPVGWLLTTSIQPNSNLSDQPSTSAPG